MGKLKNSTAVIKKERLLGKFSSLSKYLSVVNEELKSTLNALAREIKEALTSKIKQCIGKKFNRPKVQISDDQRFYANRTEEAKEHRGKP